MAATVAFAVTAVLAVGTDSDIDVFGAMVLGLITAIGGGTVRDVMSTHGPFRPSAQRWATSGAEG